MPTLTFVLSKRPFRSAVGFTGSPDLVGHSLPQAEVALVVPMRFEGFWTVPGGRSVGTRALDLVGELGAAASRCPRRSTSPRPHDV
ncbi:MAG TPA: hypothetical protein VEL75_00805 [Candidatus Methylomirabilis sp.]|nr:hypothetical protein [Candidatus Methylomirabilis sp.]